MRNIKKVSTVLVEYLLDIMHYMIPVIYESEMDVINRAVLLGTIQEGLYWEIREFGEQFSILRNIVTCIHVKYSHSTLFNEGQAWDIEVVLHPNILTYDLDSFNSIFVNRLGIGMTKTEDVMSLGVKSFDLSVDLEESKSINLVTWADFATIGYIYPFKEVNYKKKFTKQFVLDVKQHCDLEVQSFSDFAAKDKVFFSNYNFLGRYTIDVFKIFNTLGLKYGYVYDNFWDFSSDDLLRLIVDCLKNNIEMTNTILLFSDCYFRNDEIEELEKLLNSYNIQYFYDDEEYYKAIYEHISKESIEDVYSISRIREDNLFSILKLIEK